MTHGTHDTLFEGTLTLHQPARGEGYRVNVDAVLLAWFAGEPRVAEVAVDLGAGVGAVALSMLYRNRVRKVVLVEKDAALSKLSAQNLLANGWGDRGEALCLDLAWKDALPKLGATLIVSNPPYHLPGRGRAPQVAEGARVGELTVFTRAARRALGPRGRACFVYPASELGLLLDALRADGLEPKRLTFVHSGPTEPARVALVESLPAKPGGLVVTPPLIERTGSGPSSVLAQILAARSQAADRV